MARKRVLFEDVGDDPEFVGIRIHVRPRKEQQFRDAAKVLNHPDKGRGNGDQRKHKRR